MVITQVDLCQFRRLHLLDALIVGTGRQRGLEIARGVLGTRNQNGKLLTHTDQELKVVIFLQRVLGCLDGGDMHTRLESAEHKVDRGFGVGFRHDAAASALLSADLHGDRDLLGGAGPADADIQARGLAGQHQRGRDLDVGRTGVVRLQRASQQGEEGDLVTLFARDANPAAIVCGLVRGRFAESLPGQGLAVRQDVDLAFTPAVLLLQRAQGQRDRVIQLAGAVLTGERLNRLHDRRMFSGRFFNDRERRVARHVHADAVAGEKPVDDTDGGVFADGENLAAIQLVVHAVGGIDHDRHVASRSA